MSEVEVENIDRVHPEDRSFIFAGETFHWRVLHWREAGKLVDEAIAEAEKENKEAEAREEQNKARALAGEVVEEEEDRTTLVESYERVIKDIIVYLAKAEVARFREIVDDPEREVSPLMLITLRTYLQERQTNRPTEQPSPSDAGRGNIAPISQAA